MVMAISATILASCSTMENVTKVENKRTLILDKSLNVSYRIITQQLQKCLSPEFKGALYPDTQTAKIFISGHGLVGDVHDLKAIDENHTEIKLRTASDFADQLNVHVNHLNRAVKETSGKTTSNLIGERLLQEAKIKLKQSKWNVSEIAFSLGFKEVTHFNNFFKKHTDMSPVKFRIA